MYSFENLTHFSHGNNVLRLKFIILMVSLEKCMCFFNRAEYSDLDLRQPNTILKNLLFRKYYFPKLSPFSQGRHGLHAPVSNTDGFVSRHTYIPSSYWTGLLEQHEPFSTLKTMIGQEEFLSKTISMLTKKQCARGSCFKHGRFSLERSTCFLNSAEQGYLEQSEPMSTLEKVRFRTCFYEKPTQFSNGSNVQDPPPFCPGDVLLRDTCVSSLSSIDPFGTKGAYLHLENPTLQEVVFSNSHSVRRGKPCARRCTFYHRWFSWRQKCVSSRQLNRPIWHK